MFWGILIAVLAGGVFVARALGMDSIDLMAMYTEMGIGVGIGGGTATVIFAIGAGVVSAIDYSRKKQSLSDRGTGGANTALAVIGGVLMLLGVIDFVSGNFMGIDFTGVSWSPIVFGTIGGFLFRIGTSD